MQHGRQRRGTWPVWWTKVSRGLLQTNSGVTITAASGAQVTVNKDIGRLFQNSNITLNIYHIYIYAPIERGSSQTVNTYVPEVADSKVTVTSESLPLRSRV